MTLNDGMIGIFQSDQDPITFLTTASIEKDFNEVVPKKRGSVTYPTFEIQI